MATTMTSPTLTSLEFAAGDRLVRLVDAVFSWREQVRERRALAAADDRILSDLGRGRGEAVAVPGTRFWHR